jgi:DNA polymerase
MRTVFMDYETYYDKEYSLRKMTPVEYVLDPRFENVLCAVREGHPSNQPTYYVDGADFERWVKDAQLETAAVVTHNALFDMSVLAWRYQVVPRLMVDTLAVSRAVLGHRLRSLSLASVAKFLGLGVKGGTVHNVIGMTRQMIKDAGLWDDYAEYSKNDADLCAGIYERLVKSGIYPIKELFISDMVLRCAIQPKFMVDQLALANHLVDVQQEKADLLLQAQAMGAGDKKDLMSNDRFAELLRAVGCEPPMKKSPKTGLMGYAFAKTDQEFIDLEEEGSPAVQALIAARLGFKSTIEESRTERLLKISRLTWEGNQQGLMPIPLRNHAAHTHRLGGEWKLNMQNLPRGTKAKPSQLRRALIAKPGESVFTVDASQIEARIVAWLCGQEDLVAAFAGGEDVYSSFASEVFGYLVTKFSHPNERFMGKTGILSLGFQVGHEKFANTIEVQSFLQLGTKIEMPLEESRRIVKFYRSKYSNISATWKSLQNEGIPVLAGNGGTYRLGPCVFEKAAVLLPNGLKLHYYDLSQTEGDFGPQWTFTHGGKPKKLYGGKLLENIVQALARIITMDAGLRIQVLLALGMQVHDELVYGVPTPLVPKFKQVALAEMRRRPIWAPTLPLDAEAGFGPSYGEAK